MKKEQTQHSKEYAVTQLNSFLDALCVDEENRTSPIFDKEQETEYETLKETEPEKARELAEKYDYSRALILTAIRKGRLVLTEDGYAEQKLDRPITLQETGAVLIGSLRYKPEYTVEELYAAMKGAKEEFDAMRTIRMIAVRTGASADLLKHLRERDFNLAAQILKLFILADLPLE
jgi:hypothetical protein